jgi:hypothetical protein
VWPTGAALEFGVRILRDMQADICLRLGQLKLYKTLQQNQCCLGVSRNIRNKF